MNDRPKLTPAQQSAAIDRAGENLALLSGAGCGKTLVLARRFTELLMRSGGVENPLDRFVALTFTDKAALEMVQRVRSMLAGAAAAARADADRRRLEGWLEELPEAKISTIHSFCMSLLRTYAIEAGVDPNFAVCADELVTERMIAEAADQAALAAVEAEREDVAAALSLVPYERLVGHVRELLSSRNGWNATDYAEPKKTLARWRSRIEALARAAWERLDGDAALRSELQRLQGIRCDDPLDKLGVYMDGQLTVIEGILAGPAARTVETFSQLSTKTGNIGKAANWGGKENVKAVRNRIKALVGAIGDYAIYAERPGELDEQAAGLLATLTKLAGEADAIYTAEKLKRGLLDFDDLLARTSELLAHNPAVRQAVRDRTDQLLIDECQDTNAFQMDLLRALVGGDDGAGASGGKLFVVGDAKQSIYRFRGAQVEVFEGLCRRLGGRNVSRMDLSFRTHPAGVAFVNHVFEKLMGQDYSPIRAHRRGRGQQGGVEIIIAGGADGPVSNVRAAAKVQAAATAERIAEMLDNREQIVRDDSAGKWRPVRPGDIAVLFARMTDSLDYERELAIRGINYYVVGGTGFFKQQEIFDLLNALRVIDNPFDDIALVGVLRGSMFGLDDNALMHVAEAYQAPYLPHLIADGAEELAGRLSDGQLEALRWACGVLMGLHRRKDAVGIDELIERLLEQTGYEATLLAQPAGTARPRRMLGNVRRLVELARGASASSMALGRFISQMDEVVINESRYEQAAVVGEAEDVVRLMTIHKAKGLEFPVVFIPDLNAGRRGHKGAILNRLDWGLCYKVTPGDDNNEDEDGSSDDKAESPLSYRLAKRLEERDQRAEDIRKLYVAATRHKDHLVLVGADLRRSDGTFKSTTGCDSYLTMLDEVLGIADTIDSGRTGISYGDGEYVAAVRRAVPSEPRAARRQRSLGQELLAGASSGAELGRAIVAAGGTHAKLPLVGPLPGTIGRAELAVTALSEFDYCPMLYRWRYELRVPQPAQAGAPAQARGPGLDPAAMGTLLHRCMEMLDFSAPQPALSLVRQSLGEMQPEGSAGIDAIAAELETMLGLFRNHRLWQRLAGARRVLRELDFALSAEQDILPGKIDLLCQDADGGWFIVDYKSDRIDAGAAAARAKRYEFQMLLYSAAAARHLGRPPAEATLYFLRPAVAHSFTITTAGLDAAGARARELTGKLVTARRTGQFERRESSACGSCPYRRLCESDTKARRHVHSVDPATL